jgi:Mn2+/Fe2+ NRAMP family transporter
MRLHEITSTPPDSQASVPLASRSPRQRSTWQSFLRYSGAGFLIAIAYVDPGNLEADLQGGSYSRYQLLWVLLLSFAIGFVFQCLSIKISLLTERHLAQVCKYVCTLSHLVLPP